MANLYPTADRIESLHSFSTVQFFYRHVDLVTYFRHIVASRINYTFLSNSPSSNFKYDSCPPP